MSKPIEQPQGRITAESDGGIRWITFDNPARMNALTRAMWAALPEQIGEAVGDDSVRLIVLRGAGERAFSAGADISEFETARTGDAARKYDEINHAAFESVMDCPKPTLAMIQGYCMGGGLEIALCCDLRIAAEGSSYAIPAAKLGIGYNPRWVRPLLSSVSPARAKEILFTGRRFSHEEALDMGLVNRVCPVGDLEAETRALAETIAANAPLSVAASKRAIDEFTRPHGNTDWKALDAMVSACFDSEDYVEGRRAFQEKRKPAFKGR